MKRLLAIAFIGCLLVGCGNKNINSLPAECQTTLEKWDIYIDGLAADSNVAESFVENNRKAKQITFESIFRQKNKDQQLTYCKQYTRILDQRINDYKTAPQELYETLRQMDIEKKAK